MLLHAHTCRPLNQKLQQVFIDKHLQGTPFIPTFKEVFTHEHSGPIIYQVVGSFPPWSLMILVGWEQPLVSPYVFSPHDLMILDIHNCH